MSAYDTLLKKLETSSVNIPAETLRILVGAVKRERKLTITEMKSLHKLIRTKYNLQSNKDVEKLLGESKKEYIDDFNPLLDKYNFHGWIRDYIELTRNIEPPTAYHFSVAMSLLGGALRRNIWADWGYFKIYPLINVFLSGPSAAGKSTAMDIGVNSIARPSGRLNFIPNKASEQYIHKFLSERCKQTGTSDGFLHVSDLATFLGDQDWNRGLVTYLIDLLDGRENDDRGTLSRDLESLDEIAVSALVASNEELLDKAVPKLALGGGFMSRFLIFHCSGTDRVFSRPVLPKGYNTKNLIERFLKTQYIAGEATLDKNAEEWYEFWYHNKWKTGYPNDEKLAPTHKRNRVWIVKIAMVLRVSEMLADTGIPQAGKPVIISEQNLIQSDAVIDWIMDKLPEFFSLIGQSNYGQEQDKIIRYLKRAGGNMKEKDLGWKMKMSYRNLREHLNSLQRWGIIMQDPTETGGKERKVFLSEEG